MPEPFHLFVGKFCEQLKFSTVPRHNHAARSCRPGPHAQNIEPDGSPSTWNRLRDAGSAFTPACRTKERIACSKLQSGRRLMGPGECSYRHHHTKRNTKQYSMKLPTLCPMIGA